MSRLKGLRLIHHLCVFAHCVRKMLSRWMRESVNIFASAQLCFAQKLTKRHTGTHKKYLQTHLYRMTRTTPTREGVFTTKVRTCSLFKICFPSGYSLNLGILYIFCFSQKLFVTNFFKLLQIIKNCDFCTLLRSRHFFWATPAPGRLRSRSLL